MCEILKRSENPPPNEKLNAHLSDGVWKEMKSAQLPPRETNNPKQENLALEMTDPYKPKCGPFEGLGKIEEGSKQPLKPDGKKYELPDGELKKEFSPKKEKDSDAKPRTGSLPEMLRNWKIPGVEMKI